MDKRTTIKASYKNKEIGKIQVLRYKITREKITGVISFSYFNYDLFLRTINIAKDIPQIHAFDIDIYYKDETLTIKDVELLNTKISHDTNNHYEFKALSILPWRNQKDNHQGMNYNPYLDKWSWL